MPLIVSGADDRQVKIWRMNGKCVCVMCTAELDYLIFLMNLCVALSMMIMMVVVVVLGFRVEGVGAGHLQGSLQQRVLRRLPPAPGAHPVQL